MGSSEDGKLHFTHCSHTCEEKESKHPWKRSKPVVIDDLCSPSPWFPHTQSWIGSLLPSRLCLMVLMCSTCVFGKVMLLWCLPQKLMLIIFCCIMLSHAAKTCSNNKEAEGRKHDKKVLSDTQRSHQAAMHYKCLAGFHNVPRLHYGFPYLR